MKNLLKLAFVASFIVILASCGDEKKGNPLLYSNNFEYLSGWENTALKSSKIAHESQAACFADSLNGFGFTRLIKEIPSKKINQIRISAWLYFPTQNCSGDLCITLVDQNGAVIKNYYIYLKEFTTQIQTWVKVEKILDIKIDEKLNPNSTFKFFIWGQKKPLFIDDVEIEFLEE